jgi:uncharacterized protein (TIGR02147 family)
LQSTNDNAPRDSDGAGNAAQAALGDLLRRTFVEAQVRNPAFSLRSFARRLAISPSALSEIMNGKRRVSRKIAERVATRLCLEPREHQALLELFLKPGVKTPAAPTFEQLDVDTFAAIADWYHFAILSLMETREFRADPEWIAARLNIRHREAEQALERLERLGFIGRTPDGGLRLTTGRLSSTDGVRNLSLRKAHANNLMLAQRSLSEDPIELRDFCATTMAIDPEKLPEAKRMIREFSDQLMTFLETAGKQTEVYNLCVQLFPLTH